LGESLERCQQHVNVEGFSIEVIQKVSGIINKANSLVVEGDDWQIDM